MNRQIMEINYEISNYKSMLRGLEKMRVEAYRTTFLKCKFCESRSQVKKCVLVNRYWYDENTGSPCGGRWVPGNYEFICPKCNNQPHRFGKSNKLGSTLDEVEIPMESFAYYKDIKG